MEILDLPEPPAPGPREVVVHPDAVGICGSDFHFFAGELQIFDEPPYPRIQGHEFTGTIERLGAESSGRLSKGDRVAIMPISSCGSCYPCRVGRGNVCDNFSLIGIHTDGGLQELIRVPESQVFPIDAARAGGRRPRGAGLDRGAQHPSVRDLQGREGRHPRRRADRPGSAPAGASSGVRRRCSSTACRAASSSAPRTAPRPSSGPIATRSSRTAASGAAARVRRSSSTRPVRRIRSAPPSTWPRRRAGWSWSACPGRRYRCGSGPLPRRRSTCLV